VTRTRAVLTLLTLSVVASAATAGIFNRKARLDAARVKALVEVLRADPDERKRKAAAADLRDADPRSHGDVIPALVGSLQHDASPGVRSEAADALRQYKYVFPVAGMALEAAAEGDANPQVRDAAKQALWEYHLGGYRSAKGTDGFAGQTAEPPLARPGSRGTAAASVIVRTSAVTPPAVVTTEPPKAIPPVPVPSPTPVAVGIPTKVSAAPPAVLNVTEEPPLAKPARTATLPISIPLAPSR
jgi:hypothetical protein